jgi:hypothetical protein
MARQWEITPAVLRTSQHHSSASDKRSCTQFTPTVHNSYIRRTALTTLSALGTILTNSLLSLLSLYGRCLVRIRTTDNTTTCFVLRLRLLQAPVTVGDHGRKWINSFQQLQPLPIWMISVSVAQPSDADQVQQYRGRIVMPQHGTRHSRAQDQDQNFDNINSSN